MLTHTQMLAVVVALCAVWRGTLAAPQSGNPLQPRPFRPTPLPPDGPSAAQSPTTLRPHTRGPWPSATASAAPPSPAPSPRQASSPTPFAPPSAPATAPATRLRPPAPTKIPHPSTKHHASSNLITPAHRHPAVNKPGESPASPKRGQGPRDQHGAATEARVASLRSPLALRLLQEAYVHSAAQEAMASEPITDADHRHHRLLAAPQHHHRHVVIPSPEAARLLASAVNHNLLADVPANPLQHQSILVDDVQPTQPDQHLHPQDPQLQPHSLQLQPQNLELEPDVQNLHLQHQEIQKLRFHQEIPVLQLQQGLQNLHLQPEEQHVQQDVAAQHQSQGLGKHSDDERQEQSEHQDVEEDPDARYDYMYRVRDYDGNDFGHTEMRTGERTWGHYYVQLPDGRLKTVRYWADDSGYHAEVEYEGNAQHPKRDDEH